MPRGFFAELQHQARVAAREREKQQRAAEREHSAALRRMEQARKADERARAAVARVAEADRKRLEKEAKEAHKADERARAAAVRAAEADRKRVEQEAKEAHIASMEAEVEERNSALAAAYEEIDGLLAATLSVDDFVDLQTLRRQVEHPPFDRTDLEAPITPAPPIPEPEKPILKQPEKRGWIFGIWKYKRAVTEAASDYERASIAWKKDVEAVAERRRKSAAEHFRADTERLAALERERARYANECEQRERDVAAHNASIDALIANLGYGVTDAVHEYIAIVMANSVYPSHFPVTHDFTFDPATAELSLRVLVPPPASIPATRNFKYSKSSDEITETALPASTCKTRYVGAVHQVALRSLHEVFEADRRGLIKTISLEVASQTTHPGTGNVVRIPFVVVAAEREKFVEFNLAAVVPAATLEHLGAAVSKDPFNLVAVEKKGVRRS